MSSVRQEIRAISRLSLPVIAGHLATMMLWVVDLMMVGRVGVHELDAVALGRLWIMGTLVFSMGVVMGVDPLVSQAHGARDERRAGLALQRGMIVALIMSVPTALSWWFTEEFLLLTGQDAALCAEAETFVLVQVAGIPFFLVFTALRQYLIGRGITAPAMWVAVGANVVNLFANWFLIFGKLGMPALGVVGAGIATLLAQMFLAVALGAWILFAHLGRGAWAGWSRTAWRLRGVEEVFHYGLPIGVTISLEFWAFMFANLLAGWLGAAALASHTIVINLASISFMVPMGISFGVVTRVGNLIGAGDPNGAQRAAWVGFALGGGVMSLSAATFILGRAWLPQLYSTDAAVIAAAAALLPIAAAFQLFDGLQVVGGGILRGMGRTRPAALFNLIGYYALALPAAYWLAFPCGHGLPGMWWGLALGLAVIALALVAWVWLRGPARVDARILGTEA